MASTAANEPFARVSPDSRWVAFQSNESGRDETYIQRFPEPGGRTQISTDGGTFPKWQRDGKSLFYVDSRNRVTSVTQLPKGQSLEPGNPVPLFTVPAGTTYEPAPDGQRFLLTEITTPPAPITILLNWKPR